MLHNRRLKSMVKSATLPSTPTPSPTLKGILAGGLGGGALGYLLTRNKKNRIRNTLATALTGAALTGIAEYNIGARRVRREIANNPKITIPASAYSGLEGRHTALLGALTGFNVALNSSEDEEKRNRNAVIGALTGAAVGLAPSIIPEFIG